MGGPQGAPRNGHHSLTGLLTTTKSLAQHQITDLENVARRADQLVLRYWVGLEGGATLDYYGDKIVICHFQTALLSN